MEHRLHLGLQVQVRDRLSDPIRDSGHAEHSRSARLLRYLDRPHRRRDVTPRGHPIPDLVEVRLQVRLERQDRLLVNTRSTPVGLDPSPCLPDQPLGNRKRLAVRFRLAHPAPPTSARLTIDQARMTLPLRSSPITGPSPLLRSVRPCAPHQYSPLADQPLGALPSTSDRRPQPLHWPPAGAGRQVPTFHTRARTKLTPPPCRTPPGQSAGTRQAHPGPARHARFRCRLTQISTRHQWIAHARLLGPHLTRSTARLFPDAHHHGS